MMIPVHNARRLFVVRHSRPRKYLLDLSPPEGYSHSAVPRYRRYDILWLARERHIRAVPPSSALQARGFQHRCSSPFCEVVPAPRRLWLASVDLSFGSSR